MSIRKAGLFTIISILLASIAIFTTGCKQTLPDKPDERFFACVEVLINKFGRDQTKWPDRKEKKFVVQYLRETHGLELNKVTFAKNFLGLGQGVTPQEARTAMKEGRIDAWGIPYDLIIASSRADLGPLEIIASVAINQGFGLYNPELQSKNFVFLKADLHSQFGDVFKNFNGAAFKIIVREVNFMALAGSAAEDFPEQIKPSLSVADAVTACIYTCESDKVPNIIPKVIRDMADSFGIKLPTPAVQPKPSGTIKEISINRIVLPECGHDLKDYQTSMKTVGRTMLKK